MTSSPRVQRELTRFVKFSVVGVIGAIVDFGTFFLLHTLLGIWDVLATTLSFAAAVTSNFLWNRYWTYPDSRSKPIGRQATQFAVVNLIGWAIRTPIFAFTKPAFIRLLARLALPALPDPAHAGPYLALALAVIIVLFWNFGINRLWTYSDAP